MLQKKNSHLNKSISGGNQAGFKQITSRIREQNIEKYVHDIIITVVLSINSALSFGEGYMSFKRWCLHI